MITHPSNLLLFFIITHTTNDAIETGDRCRTLLFLSCRCHSLEEISIFPIVVHMRISSLLEGFLLQLDNFCLILSLTDFSSIEIHNCSFLFPPKRSLTIQAIFFLLSSRFSSFHSHHYSANATIVNRKCYFLMSKSEKKKYTGFPGDCSEQQLKALDRFRQFAASLNNGVLDPRWDETYLLRFLRARKFELKETEKMWRQHMAWRKANKVDQLRLYYFPQLIQLRKVYPHGYHKHDKKYRPIYIERLGFTNPEQIWKFTTPDRLLAYYGMLYEALLDSLFQACTQQKRRETGDGGRVAQTCTILDLKDIKLGNTSAAYKFVKPASEMAQNNYPEILGNMFILNAPFLFTGIWAIVKMWIDDKTKEKIQILGSNYKKEILKYVDPEHLPDFLEGGTCHCKGGCLGCNVGPWNPEGEEYFPHCLKETFPQEEKTEKLETDKLETDNLETEKVQKSERDEKKEEAPRKKQEN